MYSFYYVEGISETDSPLFNSLAEQAQWFNKHVVKSVDDYYPPNYTNAIRVDSDDLTILSKCNYFSLTYNDKTYYYFITGVEYINEAVVNINVEMDTIQTYMFDIKYNNARISRRTIKRWNPDGSINREYIRENFGSNLFDIKYQEVFSDRFFPMFLISKSNGSPSKYIDVENDKNYIIGNTLDFALFPFSYLKTNSDNANMNIKIHQLNLQGEIEYKNEGTLYDFYNVIRDLIETPEVISGCIVPYIVATKGSYEITENDNEIILTLYTTYGGKNLNYHLNTNNDGLIRIGQSGNSNYNIFNDYLTEDFSMPFIKNTNINSTFDYRYIPQLIDENYISLYFGFRTSYTEFPLSRASKINFKLQYKLDFLSGSNIFRILEENDNTDKFLTTKVVDPIPVMLLTDPWKQYLSNNRLGVYLKPLLDLAGGSSPFFSNVETTKEKFNYSRKHPKRMTSKKTTITDRVQVGGLGNITGLADTLTGYYDLANAPTQVRQTADPSSELVSNNMKIVYYLNFVNNIKAVATIYESIGYAQDEFVTGTPIFKDRQIYNYIACSDIDLHLNVLTTSEIVDNIFNRYYNGIRYWNVSTMEQLNLHLGEVCVYDNVEVTGNE